MIEEKNWRYLDKEDIRTIHATLAAWAKKEREPIPPFSFAKEEDIESLLAAPRQSFYGKEAYPSLAEKAAIIFYTVNKRQIFLNGSKRMSTLCLLVFLSLNEKELSVSANDLTAKALWLANTSSLEFPAIKTGLVDWIGSHLVDLNHDDPGPSKSSQGE